MGLAIIAVIASNQKAATGTEVANEMSLLALTVTLSFLDIKYAFPRPTRSSWRPPIQLTKGDDPHSDHNTESGFAT
jgi:hypothetical protein